MVYDPLSAAVKSEPYEHFAEMRRDTPVLWLDSMQAYAVARYDDVAFVLSDAEAFTSSKMWPALLGEYDPVPETSPLVGLDPPAHLRLRRLANTAFTPNKVATMEQTITATANGLIDAVLAAHGQDGGQFDFVWDFAALYPVSVVADVLGVELERRLDFKHWVDDILSAANRLVYGEEKLAQIRKSSDALRAYFEALYDRRVKDPGTDLFSGFITAEVNGERLSRVEVLNLAVVLLIGGVETTVNLIGSTLVELGRRPEIEARVRADAAAIPLLLDEVLRYNAPVQSLIRHATRDVQVADVLIPAGSTVIPLIGSANRDDRKFPDADVFNIDRQSGGTTLAFGRGHHFCIGQFLARVEARIAVERLLTRFASLRPLGDAVQWMDSYWVRGPQTLPVAYRVAHAQQRAA